MNRDKENLILAAAKFAEDWWIPKGESRRMLERAVAYRMIDKKNG